jgi:hypothetical protein
MTRPGAPLARVVLAVVAAAVLLQVIGFLLFNAGGTAPPAQGRGDETSVTLDS